MILLGTIGNAFHPLVFLKWISNAIGWPAGLIVKSLFNPDVHSFESFAVAAVEALFVSIILYTILIWILLLVLPAFRKDKTA
jgi:hypothetical protein